MSVFAVNVETCFWTVKVETFNITFTCLITTNPWPVCN